MCSSSQQYSFSSFVGYRVFLLTCICFWILILYIWVLDIHWRFIFCVPEQRYQKENTNGININVPHWGGLGNFSMCPFILEAGSEEMSQVKKKSVEDILGQINKIDNNDFSVIRTRCYSLMFRRQKVLHVPFWLKKQDSTKHGFILIFCPENFWHI